MVEFIFTVNSNLEIDIPFQNWEPRTPKDLAACQKSQAKSVPRVKGLGVGSGLEYNTRDILGD